MAVTLRRLNRATLARQLLLDRRQIGIVDALRRVVALQAQEPASPYVALWNRIAGFDPARLDEAFVDRAVVKATLMRITLHAVAADEYTTHHEAMLRVLRASRLNDRRYTSTGLTSAEADAAEERVVAFATQPRSKDEFNEMLSEVVGSPVEPRLWWALRTFAPLIHVPTGSPWSFGRNQVFEAAPVVPPRPSPEDALQRLVWRYLEGFGPATARDFAQFALQRRSEVAPAFEALADRLRTIDGPDGESLFDIPGGVIPPEDTPAPPRLLGMWESVLLAYRDRSRIIPEEYRADVIRRNGDVLPSVLVDGYVAGVWRPVDDGIEVRAFRTLPDTDWDGIGSEAEDLASLMAARDPAAYRRYANWWDKLPVGEIRTYGWSSPTSRGGHRTPAWLPFPRECHGKRGTKTWGPVVLSHMTQTSTPAPAGRGGGSSPDSGVRRLIGRITRFEVIVGALIAGAMLLLVLIEPSILEAPFENWRTLLFTVGGTVLATIALVAMLVLRVPPMVRVIVLVVPFAIVNWWLISPYFVDDVVDEGFASSISEQLGTAGETPVTPATPAAPEVEGESTTTSPPSATDAPAPTEPVQEEQAGPSSEPADGEGSIREEEPAPSPASSGPVLLGAGQFVGLAGHSGTGDAGIFQNPDGSLVLRFENFDIENGPDLEVYLVPGPDQTSLPEGSIHLGALKGNIGDQNYELPPGTELAPGAYTALVWCEAFSVEFVGATIGI